MSKIVTLFYCVKDRNTRPDATLAVPMPTRTLKKSTGDYATEKFRKDTLMCQLCTLQARNFNVTYLVF